jgi:DNA modification methylase
VKKTVLTFSNKHEKDLPEEFRQDDVRYSEEFVEHFLRQYTKPNDVVFDPFMGFGTTVLVAERLGRIGYGIEYDEKRCAYVKSQMKHPERAITGDSLRLSEYYVPNFDLCFTSPPYMGHHHKENPFTAYSTEGNGYEGYLNDIGKIFSQVNAKLNPLGRVIVEVSNLKHEDAQPTPLAWDIARVLSQALVFNGEYVINWVPTYNYGYDHSYALVFKKRH